MYVSIIVVYTSYFPLLWKLFFWNCSVGETPTVVKYIIYRKRKKLYTDKSPKGTRAPKRKKHQEDLKGSKELGLNMYIADPVKKGGYYEYLHEEPVMNFCWALFIIWKSPRFLLHSIPMACQQELLKLHEKKRWKAVSSILPVHNTQL